MRLIARPLIPHSERKPEAMIRLKSIARTRYKRLLPVFTAAKPTAREMMINLRPSGVNRRKRLTMEI